MAKRKKPEPEKEEPTETPKAPASDRHVNPVASFRPGPRFRAALKRVASKERRSLSQIILLLLEEAMVARNEWQAGDHEEADE